MRDPVGRDGMPPAFSFSDGDGVAAVVSADGSEIPWVATVLGSAVVTTAEGDRLGLEVALATGASTTVTTAASTSLVTEQPGTMRTRYWPGRNRTESPAPSATVSSCAVPASTLEAAPVKLARVIRVSSVIVTARMSGVDAHTKGAMALPAKTIAGSSCAARFT